MRKLRTSNIFYGWIIVASGFANQAVAAALIQRSYGAYVVLLREEFGWSKAALSGAFSLQQVENGMLGPVQGWLIDKFGPHSSMRVGILLFGIGFILFSQIDGLTGFYLAYLLIAVGASLGGFFPYTVVIVNWFDKRRSRALSTMQTGGALGGVLVPLVALSLEAFGWRTTAFASGIIVMAVGFPLSALVKARPEQMGLTVDGIPPAEPSKDGSLGTNNDGSPATRDFTLKEAMRTPAFWLISLGHGSALLIVSAVNVHLVLHLNENLGYSLALASFVVTLVTGAQLAGTLVGGTLGDRFDKRMIAFYCMGMHAAGLLIFAYGTNAAMMFLGAILHGAAWGARGPMMGAIRADYFGRTAYGSILGTSSLIVMFGSIAGPLVAGILADRTGSYESGFTILAILSAMGSVFFLAARRPTPPPAEPQPASESVATV